MEKGTFTREAYRHVEEKVERSGGTTANAERRMQTGGGLDPLVDPSGGGIHGPIRLSLPRLVEVDGKWQLIMGPPMLIEGLLDTTGSMGSNVDRAFRSLPHQYEMTRSVIPRYDLQIINAIFGDVSDRIVLCRSQAEMAEKIAEQLTMMPPERAGHDVPEDPEYGLFAAAYLTKAKIHEWGLKSYHFTVSDAPGRGYINQGNLTRVFGKDILEKAAENSHQINSQKLPKTREIVEDLLKRTHAFFIQVDKDQDTERFWKEVYGEKRLVQIPDVDFLAQTQAALIGLTEGTLELKGLKHFLTTTGKMEKRDADQIVRALSHINVAEQTMLPNFNKIPEKGSLFETKTDLWPIGHEFGKTKKPNKPDKPAAEWL